MVAIILFLIESEENVPCSEMPVPSDFVGQSKFCWYVFVRILFSELILVFLIELSLCKPQKP